MNHFFKPKLITFSINIIANFVEFLLGLRIILKLFAASPQAPFVSWLYNTTEPLLYPFIGMFPAPKISGGFIIEFSSIFAILIYSLLAYLLQEIISTLIHFAQERDSSSSSSKSTKKSKK